MAFRLSSLLVALMMVASATAQIVICHVTSDADIKTFETLSVSGDEYAAYEAAGALLGPCQEWLGQLCDDNLKCTVDYDMEAGKCLPEPRETMDTCVETTDE